MSRYIDADAAIARIAGQMSYEIEVETGNETDCVDLAEELLNDIPSIDIVRCKECKHWERLNYEAPKEGWCDDEMPYSDGRWVDADDFCSYGERKESE